MLLCVYFVTVWSSRCHSCSKTSGLLNPYRLNLKCQSPQTESLPLHMRAYDSVFFPFPTWLPSLPAFAEAVLPQEQKHPAPTHRSLSKSCTHASSLGSTAALRSYVMGHINVSNKELQVALVCRFNPKLTKALIYHKPLVVKADGFLLLYSQSSITGGRNKKEKKEKESSISSWTTWVFNKRINKYIQLPGKTKYRKESQ